MIKLRRYLGVLIAAMLLAGISVPGWSAGAAFLVSDVVIDATAKSAADAQGKAQDEGFRLAYQALLDRLVPRAEQARMPTISDDQLAGIIKSFQVTDEKRSSTRYLAALTVQFKPDQTRYWFRNAGVSISETLAERTLLVPVWTPAGDSPQLWGGLNVWRQAIENRGVRPGDVLPTILADGDLQDLQTLTARQALAHDQAAITALGDRYGADRYAIVAVRLTDSAALLAYSVNDPFGPRRWTEKFPRRADTSQSQDEELSALADAALMTLGEDWKQRTLIGAMTNASMAVTVPIASLKGWQGIKTRLEATAGVRQVTVREITLDKVLIDISYQGQLSQLQVGLEAQQLRLAADYDGRATLFDLNVQGRMSPR
ncbi:MAG: DUF2066 domain-containing protein [Alphaproteobacteria bacterium]